MAKLEGWKAVEAAMNRRAAREQWADAEAYEKEISKKLGMLEEVRQMRVRTRTRRGSAQCESTSTSTNSGPLTG